MEQLPNSPEQDTSDRVIALSPQEALERKRETIPNEVIEVVNQLLTERVNQSGNAMLLQRDIVQALVEKGFTSSEIFSRHWLDFEDNYRRSGWEVVYDKPGYNESYEPSFNFSIPDQHPSRGMGRAATAWGI